jgi:competence protein ComEC
VRGPGRWVSVMLGAVLGAAAQLQQPALSPMWVYTLVLLVGLGVGLAVWRFGRSVGWGVAAGWLGVAACLLWGLTGWRASLHADGLLERSLEGQDLVVEGYVAGLPRQGDNGWQFEFDLLSGTHQGRDLALPSRARLSWGAGFTVQVRQAPMPQLQAGQRWRMTVRLQRPHGLSNPHGFDAELWLWEQGVQATGYVRLGAPGPGLLAPELLATTWRYPVQRLRQAVRDDLLFTASPRSAAGVLAALVVGDQASISAEDWHVFRVTGIAHLVSVSGVHVTMFAWLAIALVGVAWRRLGQRWPGVLHFWPTPVAASVMGVGLAALYALFSGWGVPSQRTVLMLAVVVALRLSGRRWPWPVVWLTAMTAVVLIDPWALLQAGFWLSFVAVGVLFATAWSPNDAARSWLHQLRELLRTQALVTVSLAPLTLMLFGQFSLVSLVANLFAIPWVTLLVTPLAMLGVVVPGLWALGAWSVEWLLWMLGVLAAWPFAAIERPALPWGLAVLAVLGGVLLVLRLPAGLRVVGLVLLWPALVYQPARPLPGTFEVLAADVGQGTAVIVRTATRTLLFDTGPPMGAHTDAAQRVLLPLLRGGGEKLDAVVVSHSDADHAGGMASIARAFPEAEWWASFSTQETLGREATRCTAGQVWEWDGVIFSMLHPSEADHARPLSDNAMSCVLHIGAPGPSVMLTGDITTAEETRLAMAIPGLRATLLLAAHHGSHTSTGPVWLNVLKPEWVIIQAGHRNRYGHPSPRVTDRLAVRGIPWVNTASCGAARWRSDVPEQVECHRASHARYWRVPSVP